MDRILCIFYIVWSLIVVMSGDVKPMAVALRRDARPDAALRDFRRFPFAAKAPSEPMRGARYTRNEIEIDLSNMADGWDERVSTAMGMPETLLAATGIARDYYSQDEGFGVARVYGYLAHLMVPREMSGYGIAIDRSRHDSFDFMVVDPARRIIVRERLSSRFSVSFCDWHGIADRIDQAAEMAARVAAPDGVVIRTCCSPYVIRL